MAAGDVSAKGLAPGQPVADGDMLDATLDRFGRVWVLGSSSLTLVDAAPDAARPR
jgi:hypothetical protein